MQDVSAVRAPTDNSVSPGATAQLKKADSTQTWPPDTSKGILPEPVTTLQQTLWIGETKCVLHKK